ncbi:MAG: MFS transporter [Deltaproteobacteria bacterium]|jgi:OPA family glycerol-3-phosphate transporter-like MFS transporter|nr:MFS transporter [Deltaproteobacteria bacterium]
MSGLKYERKFSIRRFFNWFPLGLAYASLYMGRYSYIPAKEDFESLMGNTGLGLMTMTGAIVYGVSFLFNGPLTDRIGGRKGMLIATAGSCMVNAVMGALLVTKWFDYFVLKMSILYGFNMYFQSFAAVSIVKVNSNWFNIKERGVFGGIFGILISLGLFLAYTVSPMVMAALFEGLPEFYFFIPSGLLAVMFFSTLALIRDTPADAGFPDFSTGTDTEFDSDTKIPTSMILKKILTHPVVLSVAFIELCTGVLRDGMFQWFGAWTVDISRPGVRGLLGVGLFLAGAAGSFTAGFISDKFFDSRRLPVATFLYSIMLTALIGGALIISLVPDANYLKPYLIFGIVIIMAFGAIGTHGVLSGAATADFGGKQATATATGTINGFTYIGVAIQGVALGFLTDYSWHLWFPFLIPFAAVGLFMSYRLRKVKPKLKKEERDIEEEIQEELEEQTT